MEYHSLKNKSYFLISVSIQISLCIFFSFHQSELICWLNCWQSFLTLVISICFFIGFAASSGGEVIFPVFLCAHHPPLLSTSGSLFCQLRPLFPWSHWQNCRSMPFLGGASRSCIEQSESWARSWLLLLSVQVYVTSSPRKSLVVAFIFSILFLLEQLYSKPWVLRIKSGPESLSCLALLVSLIPRDLKSLAGWLTLWTEPGSLDFVPVYHSVPTEIFTFGLESDKSLFNVLSYFHKYLKRKGRGKETTKLELIVLLFIIHLSQELMY